MVLDRISARPAGPCGFSDGGPTMLAQIRLQLQLHLSAHFHPNATTGYDAVDPVLLTLAAAGATKCSVAWRIEDASLAVSAGGDGQGQREDAGGAGLAQEHGGNGHRPAGIDLIVDEQDGASGGIGLDGGGEAVGHGKGTPE